MGLFPYDPAEVASLKDEAQRYGIRLSSTVTWELLRTTHHRGIAIDALLMEHRPDWVTKIIGSGEVVKEDGRGTN